MLEGINLSDQQLSEILTVDKETWKTDLIFLYWIMGEL